jgi:hypothetical protein
MHEIMPRADQRVEQVRHGARGRSSSKDEEHDVDHKRVMAEDQEALELTIEKPGVADG